MTDKNKKPDLLQCDEVGELLPLYLYDEVSSDEHRRVDDHIGSCESCRQDLDRLEFTRSTLDQVAEIEMPDTRDSVSLPVDRRSSSVGRKRRSPSWGKIFASVSAVLLLSFAVLGVELQISPEAVTLRWGHARSPVSSEFNAKTTQDKRVVDADAFESEFATIRDELVLTRKLVHALAANVDTDRTTSRNLYQLIARRLNTLETGVRRNDFRLNSTPANKLAAR